MTVSADGHEVDRKDARFVIEGDLTLPRASELRSLLHHMLTTHDALEIDCQAAVQVDLCGIQLLLATRRSANQCGKRITLSAPADGALRAALDRGGFLNAAADPADRSFWLKDMHNQ